MDFINLKDESRVFFMFSLQIQKKPAEKTMES